MASIAFFTFLSSHNAFADGFQDKGSNSTEKWTDSPATRGTLDIVFSCLFTIFACTWTVLHLKVPDPAMSDFEILLLRVKWMAVNILCPEFILASAIFGESQARENHNKFKESSAHRPDVVTIEWNERQEKSLGGWEIQGERSWKQKVFAFFGHNKDLTSERNNPKLWTMTHTRYLNMGGLLLEVPMPHDPDQTETFSVATYNIASLSRFDPNYTPLKPFAMSENEILDKNKGDGFSKFITVAQILWLMVSIITRKIKSLPSSQLEILTLAFAALAVFSYAVQWNKPKAINVPTTVYLERLSDDVYKAFRIRNLLNRTTRTNLFMIDRYENSNYYGYSIFGFMIIFGALHCLAWNFTFSSTVERTIWSVASIVSIGSPVILMIGSSGLVVFSDPAYSKWVIDPLFWVPVATYCAARLAIIGIAFSSLRSMPAGVYYATWSKYVPNVQ